MRRLALYALTACAGALAGAWAASALRPQAPPPLERPAVTLMPGPTDPAEVKCLATTPEGVRLYRIKCPEAIVPTFVAVTADGRCVSVR